VKISNVIGKGKNQIKGVRMKISDKYLVRNDGDYAMVKTVLDHKKLSGTSSVIRIYERGLSEFFKSRYAIATSSGEIVFMSG